MTVRPLFASQTAPQNTTNEERENAKVWLNIGYTNPQTGEFVNLPFGLAIDNMRDARIQGQNQEWNTFQNARNELLKALKAMGDQLQPGEDKEIKGLTLKLRRVAEPAAPASSGVDLIALLTGQVPAPVAPATKPEGMPSLS
jgi:hypothetical protein